MDDERAIREPCVVIQELLGSGWSAADVCRAFAGVADRAGPAVPLLGAGMPLPPSGALVRVRCMVQDVFGPEMFAKRLGKLHTLLGASVAFENAGDEVAESDEEIGSGDDEALLREKLADRTVLACVRIPGESAWVVHSADSDSFCDEDDDDDEEVEEVEDEDYEDDEPVTSPKRHKASEEQEQDEDKNSTTGTQTETEVKPPDFLVKVYDDGAWSAEDLRVNGAFEVVGVLESDVALQPPRTAPDEPFPESEAAQHPPALLCPRVHLLACRPLSRGTGHAALLPRFASPLSAQAASDAADTDAPLWAQVSATARCARSSVLAYLAGPLGGDALAAEYVLLALLARITARHDGVNVGQLGVALTGVTPRAASLLVRALRRVCARVVRVPLTAAALARPDAPLAPYKDYARERLVQTPLQLAAGTVVVVDETRLAPGTLGPAGLRNLQHLRDLAHAQRVRYNFGYHEADFSTDSPVLALCRAGTASLVLGGGGGGGSSTSGCASSSSSITVPLCPRTAPEPAVPPAPFRTRGEFLSQARLYVCGARELPQDVDGAVVAQIQDDFVAARKAAAHETGARAITQDTLHAWMNLARAVALSFGEQALSPHAWAHMRHLETQRLDRLQPQDPSPSSSPQQQAPPSL